MPGYAYVNPFIKFQLTKGLSAALNVNNVLIQLELLKLKKEVLLRIQNNIVRARSINGRTTSLTLAYKF